ncbi:sensor histidine kinase [Rhizohabitans arisaemae]|uniref:sensor histidine kinase n=1 Tax=Rhizohabitans arisaemae TaxID=2720610 RepID=UPI0024B215F7|nr:ATP-binding protein [Rhizohabitans arisaemae]
MAARSRTIRFRLYSVLLIPSLTLIALWGYVSGYLIGDVFELLRASALHTTYAAPSTDLALQLQRERLTSSVYLSVRTSGNGELTEQRGKTDQSLNTFRQQINSLEAETLTDSVIVPRLARINEELGKLQQIRDGVDAGRSSRLDAITGYNRILDAIYRLSDQLVLVPDIGIYQQARGLQLLDHAREQFAREDALISGAIRQGQITPAEHLAFTTMVANRRFLYDEGLEQIDGELRGPWERLLLSNPYTRLAALEDKIIASRTLPAASWGSVTDQLDSTINQISADSANLIAARAQSVPSGVILRLVIAGGIGLIAIIVAIAMTVRFGRRVSTDLANLRTSALDLAEVRLPRVVEKLRTGQRVEVAAEAPPLDLGGMNETEEIKGVGQAFSTVQRTAVEAAVGQAELRKGVNQVFLNLARRSQTLLHRQLTQLDAMQRRIHEPETLEDLFRVDHLTTRMRRHAENLIILSGSSPGRAWRKAVPILDVVRGSISEVEDYSRVTVHPFPATRLKGPAVADITHLVAELVENATIYSPPDTHAHVSGEVVGNGFVIEIEDRGLGIPKERLAEINERLATPQEFNLSDSDQMGLFVVGRLAERHGVRVMLQPSPYGGTTAIVLLPQTILEETEDVAPVLTTAGGTFTHPKSAPAPSPFSGERASSRADAPVSGLPVIGVAGDPDPGDSAALPRRIRQTHLAPQLRDGGGTPPPAVEADDPIPTPEQARSVLTSLARGRRRLEEEERGTES